MGKSDSLFSDRAATASKAATTGEAAAYIAKSGATAPSEDELLAFLKERLLPYQVPLQILAVDEMPRTPSLKVSQPDLTKQFLNETA